MITRGKGKGPPPAGLPGDQAKGRLLGRDQVLVLVLLLLLLLMLMLLLDHQVSAVLGAGHRRQLTGSKLGVSVVVAVVVVVSIRVDVLHLTVLQR